MSSVQINTIQTFDYKWSYKAALSDDKVSSVLKYKDQFQGWLARTPAFKSAHPDILGLKLVEIDAEREEGGLIAVTLKYEASAASIPGFDNDARPSKYHLEPTLSDEPILTFHKIQDWDDDVKQALRDFLNSDRLAADYNKALGAVGLANNDAITVLSAIADGQESYLNPQVIWSRKKQIASLSSVPLDKIGKIDIPPGDAPTPDNTNWLYLAPLISQNPEGSFELEERWQRSYEGGWKEFFYASSPA